MSAKLLIMSPKVETVTDDFADKLGKVLLGWAERHPTPDEPVLRFVGETSGGELGTSECSPRQYAQHVVDRTSFGMHQIELYHRASTNQGDPTGQKVINELKEAYGLEVSDES